MTWEDGRLRERGKPQVIKRTQQHIRPFVVRSADEEHRAATQLELLFDLVFVIAIAAAAHGLRHAITSGHVEAGIVQFAMAFFMVWWPWNLQTWFASSFDNDDAIYRVNVIIMMFGAMFIAASMPAFFKSQELTYIFIGYVIVRLASVAMWIRAGRANPEFASTARLYAGGQILLQALWAVVVFFTESGSIWFFVLFAVGVAGELVVPWFAEQGADKPWHRHHIIERFGLLNIIVLGEVLLSSSQALTSATDHGGFSIEIFVIALLGSIIAFAMWWLYFCEEEHLNSTEFTRMFVWSYGHILVFAAGAAVGAGLGVALDSALGGHGSHVSPRLVGLSISIPVALYVFGLWLIRDRYALVARHAGQLLFFATAIAASGLLPHTLISTTVLLVVCLIFRLRIDDRGKRKSQ